jgi:hypothetical protein
MYQSLCGVEAMIGVEAAYGFGDGVFIAPLLKALADRQGFPVEVAVQKQCADAFVNLPWVRRIHHINNLGDGKRLFDGHVYCQVTPNVHFPRFKERDPEFSLIDCARETGRAYGLNFDQRPIIRLTDAEKLIWPKPYIMVESHHKSGQSWANRDHFLPVVEKYRHTHDVLWLSLDGPPLGARGMGECSRRQLISLLGGADAFFSVGSGFFCASLALPKPPKTICLWIDDYYKYERRLAELRWNPDLYWMHNEAELTQWLRSN